MPLGRWWNVPPLRRNYGPVLSTDWHWFFYSRSRLRSTPLACVVKASMSYSFSFAICIRPELFQSFTNRWYVCRVRDVLHRGDRAMIYIFIASSYFPWLTLMPNLNPDDGIANGSKSSLLQMLLSSVGLNSFVAADFRWTVWFLAAMGILYQQIFHEKYKWLETFIYVLIGLLPSLPFVHSVSEISLNLYSLSQIIHDSY